MQGDRLHPFPPPGAPMSSGMPAMHGGSEGFGASPGSSSALPPLPGGGAPFGLPQNSLGPPGGGFRDISPNRQYPPGMPPSLDELQLGAAPTPPPPPHRPNPPPPQIQPPPQYVPSQTLAFQTGLPVTPIASTHLPPGAGGGGRGGRAGSGLPPPPGLPPGLPSGLPPPTLNALPTPGGRGGGLLPASSQGGFPLGRGLPPPPVMGPRESPPRGGMTEMQLPPAPAMPPGMGGSRAVNAPPMAEVAGPLPPSLPEPPPPPNSGLNELLSNFSPMPAEPVLSMAGAPMPPVMSLGGMPPPPPPPRHARMSRGPPGGSPGQSDPFPDPSDQFPPPPPPPAPLSDAPAYNQGGNQYHSPPMPSVTAQSTPPLMRHSGGNMPAQNTPPLMRNSGGFVASPMFPSPSSQPPLNSSPYSPYGSPATSTPPPPPPPAASSGDTLSTFPLPPVAQQRPSPRSFPSPLGTSPSRTIEAPPAISLAAAAPPPAPAPPPPGLPPGASPLPSVPAATAAPSVPMPPPRFRADEVRPPPDMPGGGHPAGSSSGGPPLGMQHSPAQHSQTAKMSSLPPSMMGGPPPVPPPPPPPAPHPLQTPPPPPSMLQPLPGAGPPPGGDAQAAGPSVRAPGGLPPPAFMPPPPNPSTPPEPFAPIPEPNQRWGHQPLAISHQPPPPLGSPPPPPSDPGVPYAEDLVVVDLTTPPSTAQGASGSQLQPLDGFSPSKIPAQSSEYVPGGGSVSFSVSIRKKAIKRKAIPKLEGEAAVLDLGGPPGGPGAAFGPGGGEGAEGPRGVAPKEEAKPSVYVPPEAQVFVGGIPASWTDEDLLAMFQEYGEVVDAKVGLEKGTGRSKGFGFVDYADAAGAGAAIKEADAVWVDGKRLKVVLRAGDLAGAKPAPQPAKRKKVSVLHK